MTFFSLRNFYLVNDFNPGVLIFKNDNIDSASALTDITSLGGHKTTSCVFTKIGSPDIVIVPLPSSMKNVTSTGTWWLGIFPPFSKNREKPIKGNNLGLIIKEIDKEDYIF